MPVEPTGAALRSLYEEFGDEDGWKMEQQKTSKKLWIPTHRDFRAVLDTIPKRSTLILTNTRGEPWSGVDGLKSSWQIEMARKEMAPIHALNLKFHGLRKTATITLLEAGCTHHEVQAITGQSLQIVEHTRRR